MTLTAALLGLIWMALTIFSLSAGYHRLFSHRAYEAHPLLRGLLLAFGAACFQNSAIMWAADHRRHHQRVDTENDPYNAREGFWHSHIGWVLRKTPVATDLWPVPDLERDPLIRFQHRHYALIGTLFGFILPTLIGLAAGDVWGGFIIGGVLRLVVVYHVTFTINSLAHMLGTQPYSDRNTSRDSFIAALLSMGEGYHNFHHTFPVDYRNGVRIHQFDPSKWSIRALSLVGLARNLKRTPRPIILRARLRMEERRLQLNALPEAVRERYQQIRQRLDEKVTEWQNLLQRFEAARDQRRTEVLRRLKAEMRLIQRSFRHTYREWEQLVRDAKLLAQRTELA
jgi:stearoyl-CoA desaturase (delta-9 desaturase)